MRHVLSRSTRLGRDQREKIEATYRQIEARFEQCVQAGVVETDPYLDHRIPDTRRGLTLLARPNSQTINEVGESLSRLSGVLGLQYQQPPGDLHTTVLSVIPGIENYSPESELVPACVEAVNAAVNNCAAAFEIEYQGLIAASDSILVKGFPKTNDLQRLRSALLAELADRGLEAHFNRRYVMVAAHMTVVRFVSQPRDLGALKRAIGELREQPIGISRINQLELAENDWYMRKQAMEPISVYELTASLQKG